MLVNKMPDITSVVNFDDVNFDELQNTGSANNFDSTTCVFLLSIKESGKEVVEDRHIHR